MMRRGSRRWPIALAIVLLAAGLAWLRWDWLIAQIYLVELESAGRVESLQIDRVLQTLEIEPGQKIADIGAGTGVFTRPLSRAAGEAGVVYAVDINRELLDHVEAQSRELGLSNVRTVLASESDPRIPEEVDLVFLCDTLHHISERAEYLRVLRRYLRPGGRIAVIDFGEDSPHLLSSLKYTKEALEGWMNEAGYRRLADHPFLEGNFFVVYGLSQP